MINHNKNKPLFLICFEIINAIILLAACFLPFIVRIKLPKNILFGYECLANLPSFVGITQSVTGINAFKGLCDVRFHFILEIIWFPLSLFMISGIFMMILAIAGVVVNFFLFKSKNWARKYLVLFYCVMLSLLLFGNYLQPLNYVRDAFKYNNQGLYSLFMVYLADLDPFHRNGHFGHTYFYFYWLPIIYNCLFILTFTRKNVKKYYS